MSKIHIHYSNEDQGKRLISCSLRGKQGQPKAGFNITLYPGEHDLEIRIINLLKLLEEKK